MRDREVYVIDDDAMIIKSLSFVLKSADFNVTSFLSGEAFLAETDLSPGCILLDLSMPDLDGLGVIDELNRRGNIMPVIVLTGDGSVASAVQAIKSGCMDYLEKPCVRDDLLAALEAGFIALDRNLRKREMAVDAKGRIAALSGRERDVLRGLVAGLPNKTIAFDLGISSRTVEIYRSKLMAKLGADTVAEVLKIAFDGDFE